MFATCNMIEGKIQRTASTMRSDSFRNTAGFSRAVLLKMVVLRVSNGNFSKTLKRNHLKATSVFISPGKLLKL